MGEPASFSYGNRDVHVVFAGGSISKIDRWIDDALGVTRCLLLTTAGRSDTARAASATLGDRAVGLFAGARLHVPSSVVTDAVQHVLDNRADCVIAIGGGSAIGLGKAVVRETKLPLVAVPTTYSGSEMTDIWGVTAAGEKRTGRDAHVAPRLVVYDPELSYTMPAAVTTTSGINAIAHAVEALYSATANPVASLFAVDGIRRLAKNLPILIDSPAHANGRWDALCGAHLCGRALDLTTMGLHHKLCHVLGGMLDLPHALTHAILLPYTVGYNARTARDAMTEVAASLGTSDAVEGLWALNVTLGITQTLGDIGMKSAHTDQVVSRLLEQDFHNPAPVKRDGIKRLLERAIAGDPPEDP